MAQPDYFADPTGPYSFFWSTAQADYIGLTETVLQYTETQTAERRRYLGLIEAEKQKYYAACRPHIEGLASIDARARPMIVTRIFRR